MSYPHFYLADPFYRDAIEGMRPNKSKHELFFTIEPETGMPMQVQAAMQLNIYLQKTDRIKCVSLRVGKFY